MPREIFVFKTQNLEIVNFCQKIFVKLKKKLMEHVQYIEYQLLSSGSKKIGGEKNPPTQRREIASNQVGKPGDWL